jgi:Uma2 family endonuclease
MATEAAGQLQIHRLDLKAYSQMVEYGALEGLPIELVHGLLIDKWGADPGDGLPIYRLSVDTYNDIVESGALDGQPVELIEGLIVDMMMSPQGVSHAEVIEALTEYFAHSQARVRVQLPFRVPPNSMPEPDLAVLAERPPRGKHPSEALLIVEVAASSHKFDRGAKAAIYARADVPTYWLVDVPGRAIEVRTEPGADGYGRCEVFREGATVPSPVSGAGDLGVAALLAGVGK